MQHNPVVASLKFLGFAVGFILFVFMALHFGQGARDPIYVKGKPSLQWLAVSSQMSPANIDAGGLDTQGTAATVASPPPAPSVTITQPEPIPTLPHTQNVAAQSVPSQARIAAHANQTGNSAGKALGKAKHAE